MWMSHPSLPGVVKNVLDKAFYGGWDGLGWVVATAPVVVPGSVPVDAGWTVSQAELDAKIAEFEARGNATFVRPKTGLVAFIGDSITANGQKFSAATSGTGYAPWAIVAANHGLTNVRRPDNTMFFASGGYKTSDIITAGYHTLAAASPANIVVVHAGTNDIGAGVSAATVLANLQTIWNTLLAAGKTVVATTILPRNIGDIAAYTTQLHEANHLIRQAASGVPGMVLCDWYAVNLDATTAALSTKCSNDGVHPNSVGASRLGVFLGAILAGLTPPSTPPFSVTSGVRGVTPNPYAIGNASGLATSWVKYTIGAPTSITPTKVPRSDGIAGEWQQVVVVAANPATDGVQIQVSATTGYAVGDVVAGICEFQTDAAGFDCRKFTGNVYHNGSGGTSIDLDTSDEATSTASMSRVATGWLVTPSKAIAAGVTNVQFNFYFTGSGTFRLSRMQVVKVA